MGSNELESKRRFARGGESLMFRPVNCVEYVAFFALYIPAPGNAFPLLVDAQFCEVDSPRNKYGFPVMAALSLYIL